MFALFFLKRKGIRIWNWKRKVLRCPYIIYVDEFSSSDGASLCRGGQQNLALNKTAYVSNEYGSMPRKNLTDKIILNQIYNARYVRLYIDIHTSNDPDGGIEYNTVSIYELEVYSGNLDEKMSMSDVLNEFQVQTPNVGDKKLNVTLPEVEGYTVEYNGTDFGQVIDKDLTIYQPISDK